jgi:hypothetical protein
MGLMSDTELEKIDIKLKRTEEDGVKNILKHFDRIHDKLFTFNNILIVGFFALSKIDNSIPVKTIFIPIINLIILIYIEYRMMEESRIESQITSIPDVDKKHKKSNDNTTRYSLLSIITTSIVTFLFLYFLISF